MAIDYLGKLNYNKYNKYKWGNEIMKETEVKTTTNFDLALDMIDRMYSATDEAIKKGGERTR